MTIKFNHILTCFKDYISSLDPNQLAFLKIDETDRNKFLSSEIKHSFNKEKMFAYDGRLSNGQTAQFSVMDDKDYQGGDRGYAKIIVHEFNHRFHDQRSLSAADILPPVNILCNFIGLGVASTIPVFSAVNPKMMKRRDFIKAMCVAGASLTAAHAICQYGPSHEDDSDIFADLVIPEQPFTREILYMHAPKDSDGLLSKAGWFYMEQFVDMHKSHEGRIETSTQRCKENLKHHKELGMPSFVNLLGC